MSLRQQIMDAVLARAALITTANGYQTNIGQRVLEFMTTPLDDEQRPALFVKDTDDSVLPDDPNSGKRTWELLVTFDALVTETGQNADESRKAIADIKQMLRVDQTWGGLARRTAEVSDKIMLDKSGARVGGAQVQVKIVTSRRPLHT